VQRVIKGKWTRISVEVYQSINFNVSFFLKIDVVVHELAIIIGNRRTSFRLGDMRLVLGAVLDGMHEQEVLLVFIAVRHLVTTTRALQDLYLFLGRDEHQIFAFWAKFQIISPIHSLNHFTQLLNYFTNSFIKRSLKNSLLYEI